MNSNSYTRACVCVDVCVCRCVCVCMSHARAAGIYSVVLAAYMVLHKGAAVFVVVLCCVFTTPMINA